jgi:phosphoribosylanthranilate isomerase
LPLFDNTLRKWKVGAFPHQDTISALLDSSGGRGIDTPLKVRPSSGKVGYAGGFNPDNVGEKLSFLLQNVRMGEFWIDMESGVRTDDWFDTNKVRQVLAICKEVISDMED